MRGLLWRRPVGSGTSVVAQRSSFCPGRRPTLSGQRLLAGVEQVELVLYFVEAVERRHALGPDAQFADGLGAAEQEHGQDGALARIEGERLVEDLAVAHDRAAVRRQHEAHQLLVLELVERERGPSSRRS